jgi:hypothetical protein
MALIDFDFTGYDYERGVMVLSDSLTAATDALGLKRTEAQAAWDEYERAVAAGERERDIEIDDETGAPFWDLAYVYQHDLELIDEGVQALRKAYVLALYHHWERIVRRWTEASDRDRHDQLLRRLGEKRIEPPARFGHIYLLNNILKHDSRTAGPGLLAAWPALFPWADRMRARVDAGERDILWEGTVAISEPQMQEIFVAMRASGPRANARR